MFKFVFRVLWFLSHLRVGFFSFFLFHNLYINFHTSACGDALISSKEFVGLFHEKLAEFPRFHTSACGDAQISSKEYVVSHVTAMLFRFHTFACDFNHDYAHIVGFNHGLNQLVFDHDFNVGNYDHWHDRIADFNYDYYLDIVHLGYHHDFHDVNYDHQLDHISDFNNHYYLDIVHLGYHHDFHDGNSDHQLAVINNHYYLDFVHLGPIASRSSTTTTTSTSSTSATTTTSTTATTTTSSTASLSSTTTEPALAAA